MIARGRGAGEQPTDRRRSHPARPACPAHTQEPRQGPAGRTVAHCGSVSPGVTGGQGCQNSRTFERECEHGLALGRGAAVTGPGAERQIRCGCQSDG
ncbi:hypothetical protein AAFF_G00244630 [Aldrovandia affinis]|uniref:Uncharacterized protein n=1 Tax=Aldrovandia affinis TaxID=143900 RepID=A0AAD7W2Y8_9TELE|nr:hypothetical protein AAFF_G00244630 [Aldrovandia affinis]